MLCWQATWPHLPLCIPQGFLAGCCQVCIQQRPHGIQPGSFLLPQLRIPPVTGRRHQLQLATGVKLGLQQWVVHGATSRAASVLRVQNDWLGGGGLMQSLQAKASADALACVRSLLPQVCCVVQCGTSCPAAALPPHHSADTTEAATDNPLPEQAGWKGGRPPKATVNSPSHRQVSLDGLVVVHLSQLVVRVL